MGREFIVFDKEKEAYIEDEVAGKFTYTFFPRYAKVFIGSSWEEHFGANTRYIKYIRTPK